MQQPTMHHSIISSPHTTDTPQDPLYPVCTVIYKIFDGVQYEGQLHKYYPHRNVYFVRYLDGDSEEIDEQHLKPLLRPKKNKKITSFIPHQPQIHHAIVPNPSTQFTLDIDINRLRRSRRQHFHILDTTSFSNNPHTLYILGHTGNQYIITVNNTITCSCPDSNPACKHILFLLELIGQHIDFSITPQLSVSPHDVFHSLYVSPPILPIKDTHLITSPTNCAHPIIALPAITATIPFLAVYSSVPAAPPSITPIVYVTNIPLPPHVLFVGDLIPHFTPLPLLGSATSTMY